MSQLRLIYYEGSTRYVITAKISSRLPTMDRLSSQHWFNKKTFVEESPLNTFSHRFKSYSIKIISYRTSPTITHFSDSLSIVKLTNGQNKCITHHHSASCHCHYRSYHWWLAASIPANCYIYSPAPSCSYIANPLRSDPSPRNCSCRIRPVRLVVGPVQRQLAVVVAVAGYFVGRSYQPCTGGYTTFTNSRCRSIPEMVDLCVRGIV